MNLSSMGKLDDRAGAQENRPELRSTSDPFQEKVKQGFTFGVMQCESHCRMPWHRTFYSFGTELVVKKLVFLFPP